MKTRNVQHLVTEVKREKCAEDAFHVCMAKREGLSKAAPLICFRNEDDGGMEQNGENRAEEKNGYYINRPDLKNRGPSKLRQQFEQAKSFFILIVTCIIVYFAFLRMDDILAVVFRIGDILRPVIYGLGIAFILSPIVKFVEKHLLVLFEKKFHKFRKKQQTARGIGILAAVCVLMAVIVALCNMMIPELYRSIMNMIITVPKQLNEAIDAITEVTSQDTTLGQFFTVVLKQATDYLEEWMRTDLMELVNKLMSNVTVGMFNIVSGLFDWVIGLIISIYVLFGKEVFSKQSKKIIYALFKPESANLILHLTGKSNEIFSGFIIGKIIDSMIIGVLCFIGLSILDMPYTLLVSVIVGVTNVIPFFGPYIGAIPSAILILLSDPKMGIYFIIFILILQQIDGNIIGPKILGNSTGLSSFWVITAITLGGGLFGIVGMLLGVPTFAVIYYIVTMLINYKLEQKKLPVSTDSYDKYSYVNDDGEYVHSQENPVLRKMKENQENNTKERI